MNSQQLDDQAAEARDEAADRTEALDQREADMAGLVTDLGNEVATLTTKLAHANKQITVLGRHLDRYKADIAGKIETLAAELNELRARAEAAMCAVGLESVGPVVEVSGRITELETELRLSQEETADAKAQKATWMRLHGELQSENAKLLKRLEEWNADFCIAGLCDVQRFIQAKKTSLYNRSKEAPPK